MNELYENSLNAVELFMNGELEESDLLNLIEDGYIDVDSLVEVYELMEENEMLYENYELLYEGNRRHPLKLAYRDMQKSFTTLANDKIDAANNNKKFKQSKDALNYKKSAMNHINDYYKSTNNNRGMFPRMKRVKTFSKIASGVSKNSDFTRDALSDKMNKINPNKDIKQKLLDNKNKRESANDILNKYKNNTKGRKWDPFKNNAYNDSPTRFQRFKSFISKLVPRKEHFTKIKNAISKLFRKKQNNL